MSTQSKSITVASSTAEYVVDKLLGETNIFRLYRCFLPSGEIGILKITKSVNSNHRLDREAYLLGILKEKSDFVKEKKEGNGMGYGNFFPYLVESFLSKEQGDRRINILEFSHVCKDITELTPLGHLIERERVRVDPKTSAWIMGKLLKMLDFIHSLGITAKIDSENILINRDRHIVMIFDWSESTISSDGRISDTSIGRQQILRAGREVILALGGDVKTGMIPNDPQLPDQRYQELLHFFSHGMEKSARKAHTVFYEYVRSIWPDEFYPFTAHSVD